MKIYYYNLNAAYNSGDRKMYVPWQYIDDQYSSVVEVVVITAAANAVNFRFLKPCTGSNHY